MREIIFSIRGNQQDPEGNPIPYKRTLAGKFRADSVKYFDWKEYVRAELSRTAHIRDDDGDNKRAPHSPAIQLAKGAYFPVLAHKGERVRVDCIIEFKNDCRGDGDNILKGILDSIFPDDKLVWAASYECHLSKKKRGHVAVTLFIDEDPWKQDRIGK